MKYFIDTEFLEGTQKKWYGGNTPPTIDLISIGLVDEDGREYYEVSKDFNLREAWTRSDGLTGVYWIRENVLRSIFYEMKGKDINFHDIDSEFTYKNLKKLINQYGKTNKQISEEIIEFTKPLASVYKSHTNGYWYPSIDVPMQTFYTKERTNPEFYGYYADYDWVVFCWLFGKMIDLPKGFPMYCVDLKQIYDSLKRPDIKTYPSYPKQINEHNALADAKWNKKLYEFLDNL